MKLITILALLILASFIEATAVAPTLIFSTYLGGNDFDELLGMAVDPSGNVYVTGNTNSLADFPTTMGAYRRIGGGPYVTKMNPTGTALIYSTFIGPGASKAIAVDAAGNVFITGQANAGFPMTPGAYRTSIPGVTGGIFVAKLDATGSNLIYSTLIGIGTVRGLAIDADGNAYITGTAGTDYPITQGAFVRHLHDQHQPLRPLLRRPYEACYS